MDWQPIKTAPAEEYDILVAWNCGHVEIMQGHTARDYMEPMAEGGGVLTHWMLLPEPPNAAANPRA